MDFTFSPEQEALRDAVRAFLHAEAPKEYVRRMAEHDDAGITPEVWRKIVDLGWTGLLVPEAHGGLGLGLVDAVVVQEEMGRRGVPGTVLLVGDRRATLAARALGLDEQLQALAAGTAARHGRARRSRPRRPDRASPRARHRTRVARHRLDGVKPMVMDGLTADWVLVPARTRDGLQTFLVEDRRARVPAPVARHHAEVCALRVRRDARDARRPARRPHRASGAASPTTPRCCSRPSSSA